MLNLPPALADKISPEPMSGCWLWTASCFRSGYGLAWSEGKNKGAHRVVYEHLRGPVPSGLELDHLCRVRSCVNPDHLEPVTRRENVLRGTSPMAFSAKQTHCLRGHELSGGNLRVESNGSRRCKSCDNARCRRRNATGYIPPCRRTES